MAKPTEQEIKAASDRELDAYKEGWEALYSDLEKGIDHESEWTQNPYPPEDPNHDKWANGYMDADIYESGDY